MMKLDPVRWSPTGNAAVAGRAVYILDDDEAVRSSLQFFLASAGFAPRTFARSDVFLDAAEGLAPGCVLLDVRMPGFDGFEVLERLEGMRAALPTLIMTGHGDIATAVRVMKLGACDFIEKPFEEDLLIEILERIFSMLGDNVRRLERQHYVRSRLSRLTDREREVLAGLVVGRANKVIAYDLDISIRTVEMHRAAMMERLGVRTFADALRLAIEGGIGVSSEPLVRLAGAA